MHDSGGQREEGGVVRNYPSAWPPALPPSHRGSGGNAPELMREEEEDLRLLCGAVSLSAAWDCILS
jgi:hypothetical protein